MCVNVSFVSPGTGNRGPSHRLRAVSSHSQPLLPSRFTNTFTHETHAQQIFISPDTGPPEPPTVYLWSLYLCAQHYNQVDNSLKALELIDAAIDHTPTEVQLYMLKAKILKVSSQCVCVCVCVCVCACVCMCVCVCA